MLRIQPASPVTRGWIPGSLPLRFVIGGVCLYTKMLPSLVFNVHHTEQTASPEAISLPVEFFPRGTEVLVVESRAFGTELPRVSRYMNTIRYVPEIYLHHVVEIEGSYEEYVNRLSGKARHELFRKVRKFSAFTGGNIGFREFRGPAEFEDFHPLALRISRKTYQDKLLKAGLPDTDAFRREVRRLAGDDMARGYLLFHGERPIAYGFCTAQRDVLFYEHTGYDPEYREWSPGVVLLHKILGSLHSEKRFRVFDFGSGNAQWKEWYGTRHTRCAVLYYFPRNLRNSVLVKAHSRLSLLSESTGEMLGALGVKDRVKRFLRFRFELRKP